MPFRKTPFALAALAAASPFMPLGAQTATVTMEAETMTRSSYALDGKLIKLTASTGSASKAFSGPSGTYNVQVYVLAENDGTPRLEFYKGATRIHSYTYPLGSGSTVSSYTINNVALTQGETIRLVGFANADAWARVDKIVFTPVGGSSTPPAASYSGTPYSGTPVALPKAFKAVDFDKGGEGVAYHDLTQGNAGAQYRSAEDVDIIASTDASGGGYAINNFQSGEWLNYTVNVPAAGNYDLAIRAANNSSTSRFHIEVDGVDVTGPINVPGTGGWSTFQWFGKQAVPLSAGKHVLKVVAEQQYFNLSAVSVLASAGSSPTPVPPPSPSPLTIEAESMALSSYVIEGKLIKLTAASGSATKAFAGASGTYNLQVYMLPENDGRPTLELYKGATRIHSYTYPLGSGSTISSYTINNVALAQGETLKLVGTANAGAWARVDKIVLTPSTGTSPTPEPVPVPSPSTGTVKFSCSFEKSPTDCGFSEQAKEPGRATLVSTARMGIRGVRLHTKPGDDNVNGSGERERNDLALSQSASDCYAGKSAWWAHSVLFPDDFVTPPKGGLAFDFHHTGGSGQANFHLRMRPEGLSFEGGGGAAPPATTMGPGRFFADLGPIVKNQWYDFVYNVKWSSGSDGFFYAWVNGVQKLAYRGPTLYSGMGCYLKLANYHSPTAASSVIHDRVIRGTSASAVARTPLQGVQ